MIINCGLCTETIKVIFQNSPTPPPPLPPKEMCCADVIIVSVICLTIIIIALVALSRFFELKKKKMDLAEKARQEKETREEIAKKEKDFSVYRSKILEYLEKEMSSCDNLYKDFKKKKDEENKLIEQIKKEWEVLMKVPGALKEKDIERFSELLKELSFKIEAIKTDELKQSVDKLLETMKTKKYELKDNAYLIALNDFLNGRTIDDLNNNNSDSEDNKENSK